MKKPLLALLLLACTPLHAGSAAFFVQMSDPQMGMFSKDANTLHDRANLQLAVDTINRLKPLFVVVSGDLVNRSGDAAEIDAYRSLIGRVDPGIPVYDVAGNHDVANQPTPETLAAYRKAFGRDYYSFDAPGIRGIVLDSSLIAAPEHVQGEADAQMAWFHDELQRARDQHVENVYVFQHIPYFLGTADEKDHYFNIPLAARTRYLALMREYGVKDVFAGHYHRNKIARDGSLTMITTGAVGMPLGRSRSGLRIVRVDGASTESRFFDLGALPETIDPAKPLPAAPPSAEDAADIGGVH